MGNSAVLGTILTTPQDNSVTTTKILDGTILNQDLAAGCISGNKVAANSILAGHLADATISGNKIAANSILAGHIAPGVINGGSLTNEQYKTLTNLINAIKLYYDIESDEVTTHIRSFFNREMYLIYGKTIEVVKTNVKNYKLR